MVWTKLAGTASRSCRFPAAGHLGARQQLPRRSISAFQLSAFIISAFASNIVLNLEFFEFFVVGNPRMDYFGGLVKTSDGFWFFPGGAAGTEGRLARRREGRRRFGGGRADPAKQAAKSAFLTHRFLRLMQVARKARILMQELHDF